MRNNKHHGTILALGSAGAACYRRDDRYTDWRPSAIEKAEARIMVRRHGTLYDHDSTATYIWSIVESMCRGHNIEIRSKTGGYDPFSSNSAWEWWKIYSRAFDHIPKRRELERVLAKELPGLELKPYWRQEGIPRLAFAKTAQAYMSEAIEDVQHNVAEADTPKDNSKKASYSQRVSWRAYERWLRLPDGHPVKTDEAVIRHSKRLGEFHREEARLKLRMKEAWGRRNARQLWLAKYKPGSDIYKDPLYECLARLALIAQTAYGDHTPYRVEGLIFQRALLAAWRKHQPLGS